MRKFFIFFIQILAYSNSIIIDKITYNGKENSDEISINSYLKENSLLDISKIDTLVDNFKFVKNNNININIEPSKENGHVNLVITNTKTNPFSFYFTFDNHGKNFDDGKYRYTLDLSSSGLVLNENVNLTYTFVTPIEPVRDYKKKINELKPGEILDDPPINQLQKARKNNNVVLEISYPIKNIQNYINYSYKDYKKSILGNNDIYDVSGNSHRLELKLKTLLHRFKDEKFNLITSYSYTRRKSYLDDVLLSRDNINEFNIGIEYINNTFNFKNIYTYIIENQNQTHSIDTQIDFKKYLENGILLGFNLSNHLQKHNNSIQIKTTSSYDIFYVNLGINTNFKNISPILVVGIRKNIAKFNIDTSLNYDNNFNWLFSIKTNIF